MPITGQPILAARSMILHIFSAITSPSEPPKTVKSWLNTQTVRPSIVPWPVTTASPQGRFLSMLELVGAVAHERVELLERAGVEQLLDPLAGGHLALRVLLGDRVLGRGVGRLEAQLLELRELLLECLGVREPCHGAAECTRGTPAIAAPLAAPRGLRRARTGGGARSRGRRGCRRGALRAPGRRRARRARPAGRFRRSHDHVDHRRALCGGERRVCRSGADYAGQLEVRIGVRLTDHFNAIAPGGGTDPATMQDIEISAPVGCVATSDPAVGATCNNFTYLEFLYPGVAKDTKRMLLELGHVRVLDGGADGDATTGDGAQTFLTQGVFIP